MAGQCLTDADCVVDYSFCQNGLCRLIEAVDSPTYNADIGPMMSQMCLGCHVQDGVGKFPLENYEEVKAVGPLVEASILSGSMPPWIADDSCAEYVNDGRLNAAEKETFGAWFSNGMPEGEGDVALPPLSVKLFSALDRVDVEVIAKEAFVPQIAGWPETYRCHTFEWPETETRYITGFTGIPGNDLAVHHAVYFMSPPGPLADEYRARQNEDPEPGFACSGGTFLFDLTSTWVGIWSPGRLGRFGAYPAKTGIKIEPGSVVSVLIHHDLSQTESLGLPGFQMTLEETVEREAIVVPWLAMDWVGTEKMAIPAGEKEVTHSITDDFWGLGKEETILIHGAAFHMHGRGISGNLAVERPGGDESCLVSISEWIEEWQFSHLFADPVPFGPGDNLHLSCTWDNTAENQPIPVPVSDIFWGDLGLDEMCLGILYVSFPAGD